MWDQHRRNEGGGVRLIHVSSCTDENLVDWCFGVTGFKQVFAQLRMEYIYCNPYKFNSFVLRMSVEWNNIFWSIFYTLLQWRIYQIFCDNWSLRKILLDVEKWHGKKWTQLFCAKENFWGGSGNGWAKLFISSIKGAVTIKSNWEITSAVMTFYRIFFLM